MSSFLPPVEARSETVGAFKLPTLPEAAFAVARSDRARRAVQAAIIASAVWGLVKPRLKKLRDDWRYTVAVPSEDDSYDAVQQWLVEHLAPRRRRALTARSSRRTLQPVSYEEGRAKKPAGPLLHLSYDGSRSQTVTIEGRRVSVVVQREDTSNRSTFRLSEQDMADWWRIRERIVFQCQREDARDAVLRFLDGIAASRQEQSVTRFYLAQRWGDWTRRRDLPKRALDTIVLAAGLRERITDDLDRFLRSEEQYGRVGLPWHRGYVFHGAPGTGKTSLAKALAEHFEMDVYFIPLSDLNADTNLLQLLAEIDPRSMLVLEDVDVVHAARGARDDAENPAGISASGLLNALDGLATPHGLVTVMTTNNLGILDSALVRAGRADQVVELGYLDDDQAQRLGTLVAGTPIELPPLHDAQLTHAELVEAAKPHLRSGTVALAGAMRDKVRRAAMRSSAAERPDPTRRSP